MISNALKRSILRWIHLIVTIPILGYIYGKPADVAQYADAGRLIFVPLVILTGCWMYAGGIFAIISAASWLAANRFSGYGTAVLIQVILFVARKIWLSIRARRAKGILSPNKTEN